MNARNTTNWNFSRPKYNFERAVKYVIGSISFVQIHWRTMALDAISRDLCELSLNNSDLCTANLQCYIKDALAHLVDPKLKRKSFEVRPRHKFISLYLFVKIYGFKPVVILKKFSFPFHSLLESVCSSVQSNQSYCLLKHWRMLQRTK